MKKNTLFQTLFYLTLGIICIAILIVETRVYATNTGTAGVVTKGTPAKGAPVLLRLEDISPGGVYKKKENMQKLGVVAAYLHQEGVPFQVSLTPRDIEPASGYDVSITDDTEYVNEFMAAINAIEDAGGIIGIHGYTHQSGSSNSVEGFEFYNIVKNHETTKTYDYGAERVKEAIDLFMQKGIYPAYWETPHYAASAQQHIAFEEQIGLCYEMNFQRLHTLLNYKVINYNEQNYSGLAIVPTPLGYFRVNKSADTMLKWLDIEHKAGILASCFYHPSIEFKYISITYDAKGNPTVIYDQNSPLHQLIKGIKARGYQFVSIYSLVGFVPAQRFVNIPINKGDAIFTGRFDPDFNGEGILIWNKKTNVWHMVKNTAAWYAPRMSNTFEDQGIWLEGISLEQDVIPLIGYFTHRNKEDVLLISQKSGRMTIAENNGQRFVPTIQKLELLKNLESVQFMAGDCDGDGLSDLWLFDQNKSIIGKVMNQGGCFTQIEWQPWKLPKAKNAKALAGDFNGDGKSDIVVIDSSKMKYTLLINGTAREGILTKEPDGKRIDQGSGVQPNIADLNGDGKDDLLLYSPKGLWERFEYDGNGLQYDGTFGPWGSKDGIPTSGDLNGDARADLIIIDEFTNGTYNLNTAMSVLGR
ncbi:DUF2334 domain-containing protein [Dehalobacter sp. DCM]|uniref:DUF2334 domain-containing protein n=1 Tax=Dehalobacter sp. DCM TaxID=2907827 RepID=UPI003081AC5F|nr:DUF2334 domain-containing protein [Dehalobacter sp. DCM]